MFKTNGLQLKEMCQYKESAYEVTPNNGLAQWFPKCGAPPPWGAQETLKGGARGVKLCYSLKINKKHKYN
jgi:hypothetical protein